MKMPGGKLQVTAAIAAGMLAAALGAGEPRPADGAGESIRPMLQHLTKALELSPAQAAALQQQTQASREKLMALHNARMEAKAELEKLFTDAGADEQAIISASERLAKINADITRQQIQARLAIRGVLTPEQQARWQQLRQAMQRRHAGNGRPRRPERRAKNGESDSGAAAVDGE